MGHVLTSNNTPPSSSSSQPSNVQQQVSNNQQQQRASTASTISKMPKKQNQSIQTPVQVQIQQQQPQPQTTTTKCHQPLQTNFISMSKNKNSNNNSHQHHQVVAIATGPNNGQQQQQTAIQISPQQLAGLASSGNIQLATTTGIGGSKLIHLPFLNLATVGGGNIVLTTANSHQQHSANPIQLKQQQQQSPSAKSTAHSFQVQISGGSLGSAKILTSPKNRLMQAIPIEKTSTTFKTNVDVSTQSDTLPSSAMLNQLNFQQLINNQSNNQQKIKSQQIQLISTIPTTKALQIQQQQLNGSAKTTYQPVQQSYQLADSSSISTPTSASTSINSSPMMMKLTNDTQAPTSSTLNSTVQQQSNGLVIVSLEKGLETVQEQSRPRKKQLRQIFEQILESCFTESDFDLLESSLTSIATHFQLTNNTMNNNIP